MAKRQQERYRRMKVTKPRPLSAKAIAKSLVSGSLGMGGDFAQLGMMAQPGAMMSPTVREAADKMPLTSEKIAQSMGVDTDSPEFLASALAPGPPGSSLVKMAKIGAAGKKMALSLPALSGIMVRSESKAIKAAEAMEKAGKSPEEIWSSLGIYRAPDPTEKGPWLSEISDVPLKIKTENLKTLDEVIKEDFKVTPTSYVGPEDSFSAYGKASEVIDHPELFKKMPELKDIIVQVDPYAEGIRGAYRQDKVKITSPESIQNKNVVTIAGPTKRMHLKESQENLARFEAELQKEKEVLAEMLDSDSGPFGPVSFPEKYRNMNREEVFEEATRIREKTPVMIDRTVEEQSLITLNEVMSEVDRLQSQVNAQKKLVTDLESGPLAIKEPEFTPEMESTMAHELQHAVQHVEDLPKGGSPESMQWLSEKAIKHAAKKKAGKDVATLHVAKENYNELLQEVQVLNDLDYLQKLQKYIYSDNPTRNARFIRNNGILQTNDFANKLGSQPKKHKKYEYGEWLRNAGRMLQDKVMEKYMDPNASTSHGALSRADRVFFELAGMEKTDEAQNLFDVDVLRFRKDEYKAIQEAQNLPPDPAVIENFNKQISDAEGKSKQTVNLFRRAVNNASALGLDYNKIPENQVKNAINRRRTKMKNLSKDYGIYTDMERELRKMSEKLMREGSGAEFEAYQRLAGEAEARLVQERLKLAKSSSDEASQLPTKSYDVPIDELLYLPQNNPVRKIKANQASQQILEEAMP